MDMTISIRENRIITSLYEKSMNLYLYIPPHSTQLPGVLTVLVSGNILQIHSLCSKHDDIDLRMKQFYARLLVRRYQQNLLIPTFQKRITGAHALINCGSVRGCVPDKEKDSTDHSGDLVLVFRNQQGRLPWRGKKVLATLVL